MISDVTELKAKLIALVAWADGDVDQQERKMYVDILDNSPVSDARKEALTQFIEDTPDEKEVLEGLAEAPGEITTTVIKIAYLVAQANDEFHENEKALFDRIARELELSEEELPDFYRMLETYHESYELADRLFHNETRETRVS